MNTSAEALTTYSKDVLSLVTELSVISFMALGAVLLFIVVALRWGKENLVALNLALYVSYLLYTTFPYLAKLRTVGGDLPDWYADAAVFGLFTAVTYYIVRKVMWSDFMDEGASRWLDAVVLSLTTTLFGAALIYVLFPVSQTPLLTPILTAWLTNPAFFFWWLLLPLAVIFVTSRR